MLEQERRVEIVDGIVTEGSAAVWVAVGIIACPNWKPSAYSCLDDPHYLKLFVSLLQNFDV